MGRVHRGSEVFEPPARTLRRELIPRQVGCRGASRPRIIDKQHDLDALGPRLGQPGIAARELDRERAASATRVWTLGDSTPLIRHGVHCRIRAATIAK